MIHVCYGLKFLRLAQIKKIVYIDAGDTIVNFDIKKNCFVTFERVGEDRSAIRQKFVENVDYINAIMLLDSRIGLPFNCSGLLKSM